MAPGDLRALLEKLSERRPLFHSEADFQQELAWQIHADHPEAMVRLETRPFPGRALDIAATVDGQRLAIELKYLVRRFEYLSPDGEMFRLQSQAAQDIRRYDVVKDIGRVEEILDARLADVGFVIVLSNDVGYWTKSIQSTVDSAFRIHQGQVLTGLLGWSTLAGAGTTRGREANIALRSSYPIGWHQFSHLDPKPGGTFRYTMILIAR